MSARPPASAWGLLERLGRADVPVVRGAAAPLAEPDSAPIPAETMPEATTRRRAESGYAAAEIARRVVASPGEITIIAIGPLTNIAAALVLDPRVATAVKEIVVMGGVFQGQTNLAKMPGEYNFWIDALAARAVLRSGAPLRFVGLDVTLKVRLTRQHAAEMIAGGGPFGRYAGDMTLAWIDTMAKRYPGDPEAARSCAMHDPLAVAAVSRPDLITWAPAYVDVITSDDVGRGVAVADLLTSADAPAPNAQIATAVNVEAFLDYLLDRIRSI